MLNPQYYHSLRPGDSVQFENKMYRVQVDKGWKYIYPEINGKRTKIDLQQRMFKPGTWADWVLNGWDRHYDWHEYKTYADAEMAWVGL